MSTYSVAEATNSRPRPIRDLDPERAKAADEWLRARRLARPAVPIGSVGLLRQIYEEE